MKLTHKFENKCYIMVGNIGCGKSTYVKKNLLKDNVVVSRDAIRYMLGAGSYVFDNVLEPAIIETNLFIINELMQTGVNLVIDETNVKASLRCDYIHRASMNNYETIAVVLPRLPQKQAVDNRMNDPHGQYDRDIWNMVWENFDANYDEPSKQEGFDEIVLVK